MAVFLGCVGGLLAELASISAHRQKHPKKWPKYVRDWKYWALAVAWVVAGGFLAWIYATSEPGISKFVAVNVGATAPLIVERMFRFIPEIGEGDRPPGTVD